MANSSSILALSWPLRLEYLTWWQAMLLFGALALPIVLLAIRSLTGLGPVRRWVALGVRLLVLSSTVGSEAWNSRDLKSRPH